MAKRKLDPRKLLRGTAYTAKGAIAPEKGFEQEQGSSLQSALREVVPELGTPSQAALTYKKMARNATVRASLRAARTGVLGADYFVEPYDDTPDSRLIAEFVEYNLFTGMNRPFKKVLADVLKMYEYATKKKLDVLKIDMTACDDNKKFSRNYLDYLDPNNFL